MQEGQIYINSGFLPSVKTRPINKYKNKGFQSDTLGVYLKPKLKIDQQIKQTPQLIQDYYKRFKMQIHVVEPLTVSINFKQVTQHQLQTKAAEASLKIRTKSSKIKKRIASQPFSLSPQKTYSLSVQFDKKNSPNKFKISKTIQLPSKYNANSQNKPNENSCIQNMTNIIKKNNQYPKIFKNQLQVAHQTKFQKFVEEQVKNMAKKVQIKNQSTAFWTLSNTKKHRSKFKSIQRSQLPQVNRFSTISKKLTPWLNRQVENSQQCLQILEKSIQNSSQI